MTAETALILGILITASLAIAVGYYMAQSYDADRALLGADLDARDADLEQLARERADWKECAESWQRINERLAAELRETRNALTVERAYSAACDRQLRALAEQVAGKCLWPTLAADDVVVQMPKRGVR